MADPQGQAPKAEAPNPPKIIIDSDWKAQAQKEREKLAENERQAKESAARSRAAAPTTGIPGTGAPTGAAGAGGPGDPAAMPPTDFHALVGTMVTQALMYMGAFPDPETGRAVVSLEHARFHIDLLGVLEQKTKGNLTPDEASDLTQALSELRMRFVEIARAIDQMRREGKLKPAGAPGMGPGPSGPTAA